AVFAPACLSHTMISKSNWLDFQLISSIPVEDCEQKVGTIVLKNEAMMK
ncbi:hypothetical protein scyTo_0022554, partial [Scyliorhinus torazame]|nr:hypothetical protein [Scyliorhinus torazame]